MFFRSMWKLVAVLATLVLVSMTTMSILGTASVVTEDIEVFESYLGTDESGAELKHLTPSWPAPAQQQVFGDDFNERAIFVHQDDSTYLDDMLFCSAIPAAVHWEGSTRYDSMIISDAKVRENGNLIGDYTEYLRQIDATPDVDFIGPVTGVRQAELTGYFDNVDQSVQVTDADNVYDGACDIARYYWANQRQLGTDTAVLAYVPNTDGGVEVRADTTGTSVGQFSTNTVIHPDEVSWLRFSIDWDDPQADTDYRIAIDDAYALHPLDYENTGVIHRTNPTENRLYSKQGHGDVGISPYYSYLPFKEYSHPYGINQQDFSGTLEDSDYSWFPMPGANDTMTFQFGPVKEGQWILAVTNWTHYLNNLSDFRDFDTYLTGPGETLDNDYLLEAAYGGFSGFFSSPEYNIQTPEGGYIMARETGYYNVTIHTKYYAKGGFFNTTVYWGSPSTPASFNAYQIYPGSDTIDYHLEEYKRTEDAVIESVTNGASAASLLNTPLLYTAGGMPETGVVQAMDELGVDKLIIIDPYDKIDETQWESAGFSIDVKDTDKEVFNYIYGLSQSKGLHRTLVLTAQGGPWFSGAALEAAYHGAPVPALDDNIVMSVQNRATTIWWQMIQDSDFFRSCPYYENSTPGRSEMEALSDSFYAWIETFNSDFNPDCGDTDGDGVPDNGRYWDYSEDVDVIFVSPMNALKPSLERAILGKACTGRIPCDDPNVLWAVINREMLYWKVGFCAGDNPEDPNDEPPVQDHWKRVGWTFVTFIDDQNGTNNDTGD